MAGFLFCSPCPSPPPPPQGRGHGGGGSKTGIRPQPPQEGTAPEGVLSSPGQARYSLGWDARAILHSRPNILGGGTSCTQWLVPKLRSEPGPSLHPTDPPRTSRWRRGRGGRRARPRGRRRAPAGASNDQGGQDGTDQLSQRWLCRSSPGLGERGNFGTAELGRDSCGAQNRRGSSTLADPPRAVEQQPRGRPQAQDHEATPSHDRCTSSAWSAGRS